MKYIIEIENEPFGRNDDPFFPHGMDELYRAKGFKSLVFDQNGLDKLTPYTEPDREAIENEVWEFAKKMVSTSGNEMSDIWGCATNFGEVMHNTTYSEAKSKYEAWKKKKEEIRVGDEVEQITASGNPVGLKCVVTKIVDYEILKGITQTGEVVTCSSQIKRWWRKTGRHFNSVEKLLEEMREETE